MNAHSDLRKPDKIISPEPITIAEYVKEMIKYKSLILVFAQQEIKATYSQTLFGFLWGILRPLITVTIFSIIFNFFLKVPTEQPYYLFAFSGLVASSARNK